MAAGLRAVHIGVMASAFGRRCLVLLGDAGRDPPAPADLDAVLPGPGADLGAVPARLSSRALSLAWILPVRRPWLTSARPKVVTTVRHPALGRLRRTRQAALLIEATWRRPLF
jgi:hypothetical protein